MNLFRLLTSRRARNALRASRMFAKAPQYSDLQGAKFDQAVIATVAFNRSDVIEWQIHLVRKHLAEHDSYIVFDNSSRPGMRKAIQELCQREAVPYVSLPRIGFEMSNSHAAALNWITRNFVAPRQPAFFGFLDHDIFPLAPFSISERLAEAKVYGFRVARQGAWYLWGGFCFFSGAIPTNNLNFDPTTVPTHGFLDTGGANWDILYRHLGQHEAKFASAQLAETTEHGRAFEEIDGWLHAGQAGWSDKNWLKDRGALLDKRLRAAAADKAPAIMLDRI